MAIKLAKTAGFCWGVKRAMDLALRVAAQEDVPIRTLGPLIHNRQAIDLLKSKGLGEIAQPGEADADALVIIRAHGVAPAVRAEIVARGSKLCDATCPHVVRAQRIVERYTREGCDAIVVGDRRHAETIGIVGHALRPADSPDPGRAFVVETLEDIETLPRSLSRVIIVAQTTQEKERFERLAQRLQELFPDARVHNTVCSDASNRQKELRELAGQVDAIVVVGGRHSANTKRLAQIAGEAGTPTWLVETADELDLERLRAFRNIGVTAGASTPHWIIDGVVSRLEALDESKRPPALRAVVFAARFLVIGQFYLAAGAAALTYAASRLLKARPEGVECAFAGLFVLSMHLVHRYLSLPATPSLLRAPMKFFFRHRRFFLSVCVASALGAIACAAWIHPLVLLLAAFSLLAGAVYAWSTRPSEQDPKGITRALKRVQGSKDLFMAIAWTAIVVGTPFLAGWLAIGSAAAPPFADGARPWVVFGATTLAVFLLVVLRSVLVDMRDIDDDVIVGRDTLPTALGLKRTLRLMRVGIAAFALALIVALGASYAWAAAPWALLAVGYQALTVWFTRRRLTRHGATWDAIIDGQILVTAGVILAAGLLAA